MIRVGLGLLVRIRLKLVAGTAFRVVPITSQAFHLQLLTKSKEVVEICLGHIDLSIIYKVQHCFQVSELDSFHVDERMTVLNIFQNFLEEVGACSQDHLVSFNLLIRTGEGHVREVFVLFQITESAADIGFKVVPSQAELLSGCHGVQLFTFRTSVSRVLSL